MAKLIKDPIKQSDLLDYLDNHSDFSFELAVLKMLRENLIDCEHGGHYDDPVTNKSREFDIRAKKTMQEHHVHMAIECKNIRMNFPILVSCTPRHKQESFHQVAMLSDARPNESDGIFSPAYQSRAKTFNISRGFSIYHEGDPVGKSTAQVGRALDKTISANDSDLYEKWGQCLSSAADLFGRVYWDGSDDDTDSAHYSTVIPFVVVPNERLWMVTFDADGNRTSLPEVTDRCSCFIDKEYSMQRQTIGAYMSLSHIEIVTFDGLKTFINDHLMTAEGMASIFTMQGILDAVDH